MEGSMDDIVDSFDRIWRRLSPFPRALLFPGHEYTEQLLSAHIAEPGTSSVDKASRYARLSSALLKARRRRAAPGLPLPTIPTILADELAFNPYFQSLHEAASTLADAYRHRLAAEQQGGTSVWKPAPPTDGDDEILTLRPWDVLAQDEPSRKANVPAEGPGEDADSNPTLVLVSADLVRSLATARERSARGGAPHDWADAARPEEGAAEMASAGPSEREGGLVDELRLQRAHAESGEDDWAAKRSRRLRSYLLDRRALGEEAAEEAVLAALKHLGLPAANIAGHISADVLTRALTTLGVGRPLSEHEACKLVQDARAIDTARVALAAAAGDAIQRPPAGAISARALVSLLGTPMHQLLAQAGEELPAGPTWLDRAVSILSRLFPIGAVPMGAEAGRELGPVPVAVTSTSAAAEQGLGPAIDAEPLASDTHAQKVEPIVERV